MDEAIETVAMAIKRSGMMCEVCSPGDDLRGCCLLDSARAAYAVLAPALLEQGVRMGLEAAAESVEFSINKGSADYCIRALDPAAIVKEHKP